MLADTLRLWCNPAWRWTHFPAGEHRDKVTAARLQRMGLKRGWPDFLFIGPRMVFGLELKRPGTSFTPTPEQEDIRDHLVHCGFAAMVTNSYDDAVDQLRDLGIVRIQVGA